MNPHPSVDSHSCVRVCTCVHVSVCVCVCVCRVCVCVCSLLLGNPNFLSTSGLDDCKVARVGRPATDYKLVVRPWESGMRCMVECHFPTV